MPDAPKKLVQRIREAQEVKAKIARLSDLKTSLQKHYDAEMTAICEQMDEDGIDSLNFEGDDGQSRNIHGRGFLQAKMMDEETFRKWCAENGEDYEAFRLCNIQRVKSMVRHRIDNDEPLPEGVEVSQFRKAVIQKR